MVRKKKSHTRFYFYRGKKDPIPIPRETGSIYPQRMTSLYRRFSVLIKMCINKHPRYCHVHWCHQSLDTGRPSLISLHPNQSFCKLKLSRNIFFRHCPNVIGNNLPYYVVVDDIPSVEVTKTRIEGFRLTFTANDKFKLIISDNCNKQIKTVRNHSYG